MPSEKLFELALELGSDVPFFLAPSPCEIRGRGEEINPLKKYPEIAFETDKFSFNDSANTYIQAGYVASSSTKYTTYSAIKAFDDIQSGSGIQHHWSGSSQKYNTSNGNWSGDTASVYTTNVGGVNKYGEWLQIEFPHKIKYNYSTIRGPHDYAERQPRDGYILGSNDLSAAWTTLHQFTGVTRSSGTQTVTYTPPSEPTNAFKYFRLVIEAITASNGQYAGVDEWDIYGYEEDPPLGDTSVDTTFTSIMNTPQTTGANVYVDGSLGETFTNRVPGLLDSNISNTHTTYVSAEKYWELSGNVESNVTVEANTFLSGDAPHSVSVWVNSSDLESNASNSCIFSIGTEEKLDHISSAFSNTYESVHQFSANTFARSTENSNFGHSCAINTDGTRMIVGCPNEDIGASNYGAVYIYTYSDGKWDDGYRIGAPTPVSGTGDQGFGKDVAISNDGNRVVVGAWYDDTGATDAGAAYVYSYSNGSWTHAGRIQSSDIQAQDRFGSSVAMSGDGTKIIVGAIFEDTGATTAGAAYIFAYNGSSWPQQAKLQ